MCIRWRVVGGSLVVKYHSFILRVIKLPWSNITENIVLTYYKIWRKVS